MSFKNACFLSYRHVQHELMASFVQQFEVALQGELEAHCNLSVFRDFERLKGGDFYNLELARSLCESVCMIMIYTPTFFNPQHLYCTREYIAMTQLEAKRFEQIGNSNHGLIIPVVVRGFDELPDEIKSARQVHLFDRFDLGEARISRHRKHKLQVRAIAEYVAERCRSLEGLEADCEGFTLPDDDAAREVLARMRRPAVQFPGRGGLGV